METVAFSSILRQAWGLLDGHDYSDTENGMAVEDFRLIRDTADLLLPTAWEYWWWPDISATEKRRFRPVYDATANVAVGDERFFIQEGKYYQALQAQTPATTAPADAAGTENSDYWAECKTEYTANDYAAATTYAVGDQVYYPTTGLYYQCIAASTGNAPTNTTYFIALTEFDRYVLHEQTGETVLGAINGVWSGKPTRKNLRVERVDNVQGSDRLYVLQDIAEVWVGFRSRCPRLTGDRHSTTATYSSGDQVYFESGTGDFWEANQSVSAGETPVTDADKWDQVQLPRAFQRYLVTAIYDALRVQYNKPERPDRLEHPLAESWLAKEVLKLAGQGLRPLTEVSLR